MKLRYYPTVSHHEGAIYSVDFHPGGEKLITCGQRGRKGDGTVMVWSLKNLYGGFQRIVLAEIMHQKILNCVRWSKIDNGQYFACGGDDAEVFVYHYEGRIKSGGTLGASPYLCTENERYKCVHRLIGHSMDVLHLEWSHDGRFLASSSVDGTVIIWDATNLPTKLVVLDEKRGGHTESVKGISFDPVGKFFLSQSADKTLKVWTADDWKCVTTVKKPFEGSGTSTMFLRQDWSPDGSYIVAPGATNNGGPTSQIIGRNGWTVERDLVGHRKTVTCVRACPKLLKYTDHKGKLRTVSCFAVGSSDKGLSVWSIPSVSRPIVVLSNLFKHSIMDLAWSGTQLAACSMDGTVRLVDFKAKELGHMFSNAEMGKEFQRMYKTVPRQYVLTDVTNGNGCNGSAKISDQRDTHGIIDSPDMVIAQRAEKRVAEPEPMAILPKEPEKQVPPAQPVNQPTTQQNLKTKSGKKKVKPVFIGSFTENEPDPTKVATPAKASAPVTILADEGSPILKTSTVKKRKIDDDDDKERPVKRVKKHEKELVDSSKVSSMVSAMLQLAAKPKLPHISDSETKKLRPVPSSSTQEVKQNSHKFQIPLVKAQLSFKVHQMDSFCQVSTVNVNNNYNLFQESENKQIAARVVGVDSDSKHLWTLYIPGSVSIIEASNRFTIVSTSDGILHIISTTTGRTLREWLLDGAVVAMRLNKNFALVVTAVGTVWLWDLTKPALLLCQSMSNILSGDVTMSHVRLTNNGMPIVEFTNGKSFTFSSEFRVWTLLADNNSSVLKAAFPVVPPSLDGVLSELCVKSIDRTRIAKVSSDVCLQATETEFERALQAAESLQSVNEYCNLAERYVHHLVANGKTEKSREFLCEVRSSSLLGKRSQSMLKTLISILERNPEFDTVRRSFSNGGITKAFDLIWS
ncbi:hypothetical protein QR680_001034 [Steinernema hermaphroditum]|uniref:Protein HIRA n=1 Tax=Steinernema hermaphroditum TaxID=289476 RepID=A0AA39LEQ5_9BILA|nr:hypothetical protein QR680_001034 [Steinernema hermaphroditum]